MEYNFCILLPKPGIKNKQKSYTSVTRLIQTKPTLMITFHAIQTNNSNNVCLNKSTVCTIRTTSLTMQWMGWIMQGSWVMEHGSMDHVRLLCIHRNAAGIKIVEATQIQENENCTYFVLFVHLILSQLDQGGWGYIPPSMVGPRLIHLPAFGVAPPALATPQRLDQWEGATGIQAI